jgi:hypothetical protein
MVPRPQGPTAPPVRVELSEHFFDAGYEFVKEKILSTSIYDYRHSQICNCVVFVSVWGILRN